jgi:ribonucleoside-diphosphate reductase alpha chain
MGSNISCTVIKRKGNKVEFNTKKIVKVLNRIFDESEFEPSPDDLEDIVAEVINMINASDRSEITTTEINDIVEQSLMKMGFFEEAKSFILFREKNKMIHAMSADKDAMSDYVFMSRYSRYMPRRKRRETWNEAVDRVKDMHIKKYPNISEDIAWAFEQVRAKRVLPSMRSMQFGGKPIEDKNSRLYNCTYSIADRPRFFAETMFLLLTGCGVGFSVEYQNVDKLPKILVPDETNQQHITIEDSIEGWSDAIEALINSYVEGYTVDFIYKKIRAQGENIRSGGKAPGHVPLRKAIEKCRLILEVAAHRDGKLKPIEVYDIVMHISDAVLSGGVRRSATICLFSADDIEMLEAKTGNWFEENPQRGRSNNSVKLIREETSKDQFMRIFNKQKEFGEPGFYFAGDLKHGTNPCVEIGLNPFLPAKEAYYGTTRMTEEKSGFQMCNLTTINGAKLTSLEDFEIAVKAATIIGTCQAGFTEFPYVGKVTEELCKREALLGVSITGIMDSPEITLVPENLQKMSKLAVDTNKEFAEKIGIEQAARVTCVKPEGSSSLLIGTASGIHPRWSKRYLRRIQAAKTDPVYQMFKENNEHACEESVWSTNKTDDIITFCVESPENAITNDDVTAMDMLQAVKLVQENWVLPGTARPDSSPGLYHNVSNTIRVKTEEWDDVADFIFNNKEFFTGIAMLPEDGNVYQQAPHQQICSGDDELQWSELSESFQRVDYTSLNEETDETKLKEVIACAGGACELT